MHTRLLHLQHRGLGGKKNSDTCPSVMCNSHDQLIHLRWQTALMFALSSNQTHSLSSASKPSPSLIPGAQPCHMLSQAMQIHPTASLSTPALLHHSHPSPTFLLPRTTTPTPSFRLNLCGQYEVDNIEIFWGSLPNWLPNSSLLLLVVFLFLKLQDILKSPNSFWGF